MHSDQPRAITLAFAKLEDAERQLRAAVGSSPFVDGYSWTVVDAAMRDAKGDDDDSLASAARAIEAEARVASAIEGSSRELETKLELLIKNFGAPAP
jgi:hypothetical protein